MVAGVPRAFLPTREGSRRAARLRLPLPERIVRMTWFGLEHVAPGGSAERGWWRRVEREMARFVRPHLPAGALDVEMQLDPESLEVRIEYRIRERV